MYSYARRPHLLLLILTYQINTNGANMTKGKAKSAVSNRLLVI